MSELQEIARTVAILAVPGMKPTDLFAGVRKQHPRATKKDLSRAAFFAAIMASESDPAKASRVHELALASRSTDADGESR